MSIRFDRPSATVSSLSVWKRMLWKDFRELLPIWIILLAVTGFCLWITSEFVKTNFYDASALYLCGETFIAIFCVATGVFLFATETENRTIELLRGFPVRPRKLVHGKLLLGLVAALISACLIGLAANQLGHQFRPTREYLDSSRLSGLRALVLVPTLFYLFGVLAAMMTGSSFYGFVLAGTTAFLSVYFAAEFFTETSIGKPAEEAVYWVAIAATGLIVLAIVIGKAENWIEGRFFLERTRKLRGAGRVAVESMEEPPRGRPIPFLLLLWQSFRMARVPLIIYVTVALLLGLGVAIHFHLAGQRGSFDPWLVAYIFQAVLLSAAILTLLMGSTVFMKDHQQRSYQFFQQNVEAARSFWLARLLPWWLAITAIVLIINLIGGGIFAVTRESWEAASGVRNAEYGIAQIVTDLTLQYASQTTAMSSVVLLAALGVSQFFSMFVRNPVIAVILALLTGIALVATGLGVAFLDESVIWFLGPIVVALYFATWFRSKYWLADSPAWIGWFIPIVSIVFTTTAVLVSFAYQRANEFSDVSFDMNNLAAGMGARPSYRIDELEFGTAASRRETADLYRKAIRTLDGKNYDPSFRVYLSTWTDLELDQFVETHQPAIDLMLEAAERLGCEPFLERQDYQKRWQQAEQLKLLMAAYARKMLREENLEQAFVGLFAYDRILQRTKMPREGWQNWGVTDFYSLLIQWADLPNQDPQLIQSAISRIEGSRTNEEPTRFDVTSWGSAKRAKDELTELLKQHYASAFRDLNGERAVFELVHSLWEIEQDEFFDNYDVTMLDQLPWEQQRSRRLLKRQAINEFSRKFLFGAWGNDTILDFGNHDSSMASVETYRIPLVDKRIAPHRYLKASYYQNSLLPYADQIRRYALLRLALAAYRTEHGSYPDTLQPLNVYFKKNLPTTLRSGRDFAWFPQGLPAKAFVGSPEHPRSIIVIRSDVPVLLPFAVEDTTLTSELVSFQQLDQDGQPTLESELGIQLEPDGGLGEHYLGGGCDPYLPQPDGPSEKSKSPGSGHP